LSWVVVPAALATVMVFLISVGIDVGAVGMLVGILEGAQYLRSPKDRSYAYLLLP
jgi:hypothetical protein